MLAGKATAFRRSWCPLLLLAALLSPLDTVAGVYLMSPGKWRDGKISWRYNASGLAPGTDEAAILATVQRAFDAWSAVCNITAEYAGTTSTALDQTSLRSEVVLGYTALPYPQAADAAPDSEDAASSYTYFTSGKIRISNSVGANIQYNPDTLTHEVGHLLGLDHSDEPYSIMYANPYNAVPSPPSYQLFGDDITACADLYGGKGIQSGAGYGNALPVDPQRSVAKLELAAIVEQNAGSFTLRLQKYSSVGIDYSNAYLNTDYARNIQSFTPPPGDNTLEVWVKSNAPRYTLDLTHNIGGQSLKSHDQVRQLRFTASGTGSISGSRLDSVESGTLAAYSARANLQVDGTGGQAVYVAAVLSGTAYFRSSHGWSRSISPLFTLTAPGAANFDILRGFDARQLPSGTALLVGYGASPEEMLAKQQFRLVRVF